MALTFAAATFDDHDMHHIMYINNRVMKELFYDPEGAQVLFNSLDEIREFLTGSISVIVEFDETPIAVLLYKNQYNEAVSSRSFGDSSRI